MPVDEATAADEVQAGLFRAADALGEAKLVVRAVAGNRFSRRLLTKNQQTLRAQAEVLREVAAILGALAEELPRDYSVGASARGESDAS